jgi:ribosomal-protein-alanine N-acetyltransferase
MRLVAATAEHVEVDINDHRALGAMLGAVIPQNWPPEILTDALPFFLTQLRENPGAQGWSAWYWIARDDGHGQPVLVGSGGFRSEPTADGTVEMGHSVLPQFQGRGYATEAAQALISWAGAQGLIKRIIGQTSRENIPSIRVLDKLGFTEAGPGLEPGLVLFELVKAR